MDEPVRWVTKVEAAEELEVSLSTLDRMIRRGDVDVRREGRRIYVRMHGPEYLSDEELLRRAIIREEELKRTVRELEQRASELQHGASELERERDEAKTVASASEGAHRKLEIAYDEEYAAHLRTKRMARTLGLVAVALFALLAVGILVAWRLFA